jgi:hypothetical protein
MSLTRFTICLMLGAIVTVTTTEGMAAPQELVGKSIVVTWTEEGMRRKPFESTFGLETRHLEFNVYVSSLGRIFNRLRVANGRGKTGSVEEIGGKISFPDKSIVAVQTQERGARRIAVIFDQTYSSCTAEVIHGKEAGASTMIGRGLIGHTARAERKEIESVRVGGASCSIKEGNIFGE